MKKLRTLLTILMVGVCSWQSAWADDVVANVTLKEKNSLKVGDKIKATGSDGSVTATVDSIKLNKE